MRAGAPADTSRISTRQMRSSTLCSASPMRSPPEPWRPCVGAPDRLEVVRKLLREGHGEQLLADRRIAAIVENALFHFDSERYRLLAWCVMPTHVHVLVAQMEGHPLSAVVQSWKSFSAKAANKVLGRQHGFWAPEYYDRFMRHETHLGTTRAYIESNPVTAALCRHPADWRFSSAWMGPRDHGPSG